MSDLEKRGYSKDVIKSWLKHEQPLIALYSVHKLTNNDQRRKLIKRHHTYLLNNSVSAWNLYGRAQ